MLETSLMNSLLGSAFAGMSMFDNVILSSDSYKDSHYLQMPENTDYVFSYVESRGGPFDLNVFFGSQILRKRYLTKRLTYVDVIVAQMFNEAHGLPFNLDGWLYIVEKLDGILPLEVKAAPEGTVINGKNVLLTIQNTVPGFGWLVGHMEPAVLRCIWYGTTVCTVSFYGKLAILRALYESCDDPLGQVMFRLHDFGARGNSSQESAGVAGAAHLVNFMGTDTKEGITAALVYYLGLDRVETVGDALSLIKAKMPGFSIPASEHCTMTSWGKAREVDAYRNMLKRFAKPGAMLAVVSDSYDLWNAVENIWGKELKTEVEDSGATLVVRPDSGDPLTVPVKVIEILGDKFGFTVNQKGFKVLNPCVRVIQGDGITVETLPVILKNLLAAGWSAENLAFGMGGGLHQKLDRDTLKFAMKASAVSIDGVWTDVFKAPITDPGKRSKKGRLALVQVGDQFETVPLEGNEHRDVLKTIYRDGDMPVEEDFVEVRARAHAAALRIVQQEFALKV